MKPLEDYSLGERIIATAIICIIILLILAFIGWISGGWEAQGQYRIQSAMPGLPTSKWDSRMFALDRDAVDEAYKDQLKHLFSIWLKSGDAQAPERAIVGARNLRRAYIGVMEGIDKRERDAEQAK